MRAYQHVLALCTSENDYLVLLWVWCKKISLMSWNSGTIFLMNTLHKFDKISFFILKNLSYFHANKLLIFFMKDSVVTWTFGSYTHHFVKSSKVKNDQNPIGTTIIHSIEAPWNDNNVGYLVFFCSQLNCKNKGNVLKCCHY